MNGGSRSRKPQYARGAVSAVSSVEPIAGPPPQAASAGSAILRSHGLTLAAALACLVLVGAIVWKIFALAGPAFDQFGLGFITGRTWDPVKHVFGALPFIYGTAVTSLVAVVLIATPLAIAIGLYLSELAPRGVRGIVGSLVELLAAIPSVVLGLWGILVLGPFLAHHVEPWLHSTLGFIPLFGDPQQTGQGLFTAAVILTIMIVPIVATISRELFLGVPRELEDGALALGATRWEMVRGVILPATRSGVAAAVILGLGRALGEAIAVTQVIGGGTRIGWSLFPPADTLASKIASSYQGAGSGLEISSLIYLAAILLVIGLIANLAAQVIVRRFDPLCVGARFVNRYRRRRIVNRMMEVIATVAALVAVAVLAIVVVSVAKRAAGAISWDFFTKPQALFGQPGGGIANAIVGTVLLVLMALRHGATRRRADRHLSDGVRAAGGRGSDPGRDRRAHGPADDRHRDLRLRAARDRPHAERHCRSLRAGDHHASARRPRDAGGASARAFDAPGSEPCARGAPLADGSRRDPPVERRGHPDRHGAGGGAGGRGDGTASLHVLDLQPTAFRPTSRSRCRTSRS